MLTWEHDLWRINVWKENKKLQYNVCRWSNQFENIKSYQNLHITSTSCTFDDLLIISLDTEQTYEPESPTSTLLIIIVEFTEVNIFPSFIHEYERVPLPLAIHCRMTSFPRKMSLCGEMISFGMLVSMKYRMKKRRCINTHHYSFTAILSEIFSSNSVCRKLLWSNENKKIILESYILHVFFVSSKVEIIGNKIYIHATSISIVLDITPASFLAMHSYIPEFNVVSRVNGNMLPWLKNWPLCFQIQLLGWTVGRASIRQETVKLSFIFGIVFGMITWGVSISMTKHEN